MHSAIGFLLLLIVPVVEFLMLQISASDGNWPPAHPHSAACLSASQEFKQAFKTNKESH